MQSPATALLQQGITLHRQGALDEAARIYAQILREAPHHAEARYYLAAVAFQRRDFGEAADLAAQSLQDAPNDARLHRLRGQALHRLRRDAEALASLDRAVECAPDMAAAHGARADVLAEMGRTAEAVESYDRALMLDPSAAGDWCNRGATLDELGRHEEAIASCERAIALQPDFASAHLNKAVALGRLERNEEALAGFNRVLELQPGNTEARMNRALTFKKMERLDEARADYEQVLAAEPGNPGAMTKLATLLLANQEAERALPLIVRALELQPTAETKIVFAECLLPIPPAKIGPDVEDAILRTMSAPFDRPITLPTTAAAVVRQHPAFKTAVERTAPADFMDLVRVADDRLLRALLVDGPIVSADFERLLTGLRRVLLELASAVVPAAESLLPFCCALAKQCFINEYVFFVTPEELRNLQRLRAELDTITDVSKPIPPLRVAAIAAYMPLHSLTAIQALLGRDWPEPVRELLKQQIEEPLVESRLRSDIPVLTPIAEGVSERVGRQYEEMPYPRWIKAPSVVPSASIEKALRTNFPQASFRHFDDRRRLQVLTAGCGTGRHPIDFARRYPDCDVLAIDLSRASLSYARRKANESGIQNVSFAQADILHLPSLGRQFDLIEAVGVLHHLADPEAGWRGLASMLRPGGFMCIALYSETARTQVNRGRRFVEERGYHATAHDIRRGRRDLIAADDADLNELLGFADFYTTSECRDLLFHVQEQQFTLPRIKAFLAEEGLTFLSFRLDEDAFQRYRGRFPEDPAMADLDNWHTFETENPRLFIAMYQFWVQKAEA